ncbi:chemotaxis protein CheA [Vagococcus penaei]|uniref:Chemotaxis protein CheA n=1 Tax=Vagococcus penaei TaxID=633807 RepID=A0A1Q2D8M6_9ENTE|nr:chemotaxis protein CheA [Vagococcus penaei]AQP54583.1 chemotaxis protein CheA [Vagococcus penaei]RSU06705.1 chemotaxis protein CheA [Vagococcus penaei]
MDDNSQYRELFFEETDDHLENLNDAILELENYPERTDLVDSIFRSAHTLKGMAATMGYETMTKLTHRMENIFQLFKDGTLLVTADSISLILDCLDKLSAIVDDLRDEIETDMSSITDLLARLKELEITNTTSQQIDTPVDNATKKVAPMEVRFKELSETDKMLITQAAEKEFISLGIMIRLEADCMMKGARAYLLQNQLEQLGEIIHSEPGTDLIEAGDFETDFTLLFLTQDTPSKVNEVLQDNPDVEAIKIEVMTDDTLNDFIPSDDVALEELPQLMSPEISQPVTTKDNNKPDELPKATAKPAKGKAEHHQSHQSIKVDLGRLDSFMNLVSELVVYRTRLENLSKQYDATEIQDPLAHVGRITTELQELVLKIRMQQVSVVTNRFPRMVRDLSKDLGKEMELIIEGDETELDRTVVSELSEPLIHLIRNSADHGIESLERRRELGKPDVGTIKLTAYQQGNRVIITLSDDGKGLNPVLIAESARRKGLDVDGLTDKELLHIIFHPGFSTAQKVTNVSGRGVGMDVVHSKIESLGGTIELSSEIDKGTITTINLPLTLSIIQSLMVKVSGQTFALPLGVIEKVIAINEEEIVETFDQEIYMYRGKATPVIRLNDVLGISDRHKDIHPHLIMVLLGKKYFALLVDELIGQQEIVIKKLGNELKHLTKYLGATILGNGDIILILDSHMICNEGSVSVNG